jgi:hypothetical protein
MQGQPMAAWAFEAPGSVPAVAVWLSQRQPALRDLWVVPGSAVLAGMEGRRQWAARLFDAGWGRTRGTISVLPLHDAFADPAPAFAWRLNGGQLLFEFQSREDGGTVVEQVWTHAAAPSRLRNRVRRDLRAQGWRKVSAQDLAIGDGESCWSRANTRLSMVIAPLDDGSSGVTVVLRVGG